MSNPFEDLRQAVVVRPMNSPGPQGPPGPEIKIQYSPDGQSWHDDPVETDRYLRFSTDNGVSWLEPIHYTNLPEMLEHVEKARQWAENPEGVEVEPGRYSALHHKEKALAAQVGAETAKTAAETARTGAETAEANALASENKAKKWAENPEGVEVEPGRYSALHHKEKALAAQVGAETAEANALESANNAEAYKNEAQYWANIAQDVVFTAEMLQHLETMGGILI